jgi:hypothetical protein
MNVSRRTVASQTFPVFAISAKFMTFVFPMIAKWASYGARVEVFDTPYYLDVANFLAGFYFP